MLQIKKKWRVIAYVIIVLLLIYFFKPFSIGHRTDQNRSDSGNIVLALNHLFETTNASGDYLIKINEETYKKTFKGTNNAYPIASLSKHFTGFLLSKLISDSILHYHKALKEIDTIFKGGFQNITFGELITHESGIKWNNPLLYSQYLFINDDVSFKTMQFILNHQFTKASKEYEYSDYNYALLWAVLDSFITDMDSDLTHILITAGMKSTRYESLTHIYPISGRGYYQFNKVKIPLPKWNVSLLKGASGLISNSTDLYKWYQYLKLCFIRNPAFRKIYLPNEKEPHKNGLKYCMGSDGKEYYYYSGMVPGFSAFILMDFKNDLFVNYLINLNYPAIHTDINEYIVGLLCR